jgi:DNA-binding response OmpR family regulator
METSHILKDKVVLVVDDEPDVLDTVSDVLEVCLVTKARDFETGRQYLMSYTYDIVVLDIMGVDGFELLKLSPLKAGFPTVMLTAYALTPKRWKHPSVWAR